MTLGRLSSRRSLRQDILTTKKRRKQGGYRRPLSSEVTRAYSCLSRRLSYSRACISTLTPPETVDAANLLHANFADPSGG